MVDTVEETRVTTETVELYVCPNCDQRYEPAEMVTVGLGVDERSDGDSAAGVGPDASARSIEELSMLCGNCARSIFDYEGRLGSVPDGALSLEPTTAEREDASRTFTAYHATVASLATWLLLFVVAGSIDPGSAGPLFGFVILVAWVALPVATFLDIRETFADHDLMPYLYAFPLLSAVWGLNLIVGAVYLLFRHVEGES